MRIFFLFLFLIHAFFSIPSVLAQEPTLRALERAALQYAGVDPEEVVKWRSRAKWAKALPKIIVGWEQRFVNQINNTIQDSVSVSSTGVTVGPPQTSVDQDENFNQGFDFRATWAFDELLFNRDSLAVSAEARYRTAVRSQILEELHQNYFERKRILLGRKPEELSIPAQLRLEEIEAKLDALTQGFFSKGVAQNEK